MKDAITLLDSHTNPEKADRDAAIPQWVLKNARGLAFLFTYKVGIWLSASGGSGVVIAKPRGSDHWGLPVSIGLGGAGGGLDFGVQKSYQIVVFNTNEAVDLFLSKNMKLGLTLAVAAGPVGRAAEGSANVKLGKKTKEEARATGAFTYGYTKGLFGGAGVQGQFVSSRAKGTAHYYGIDKDSNVTDDLPTEEELKEEADTNTTSKPTIINVVDILYGRTDAAHTEATKGFLAAVEKATAGY